MEFYKKYFVKYIDKKHIDKQDTDKQSTDKQSTDKQYIDSQYTDKQYIEKNKYFLIRTAMVILLVAIVAVQGGIEALTLPLKEVVVNDNGSVIRLRTKKSTVGEVLEQNGINVLPEDYVYPSAGERLLAETTNEVYIKRAAPVYINVDGSKLEILTHSETLRDVLNENGIEIDEDDRIEGANLEDKIFRGMSVNIVRVEEGLVIERETISYKVEKRANQRLEQGVERKVREGKEGARELLYRVVYEDGVLKTRELVNDTITSAPVNELVEYGTVAAYTTSRGETFRYSTVLNMRATSYTSSFKDTGKHPDHPEFGITYTGIKAKRGIIAVDPKVIPLGTRVYVECLGNVSDYGFALAADIGGAIKGDLIDLYFDTQEEVDKWGIKKVKVYILAD